MHCLINKNSHIKWVCRRCLTAFSSGQLLFDHTSRCINQQPTNITFSWKDHLKFEDNFMKIPLPIRVYADFEFINQPTNHPKVLFEQFPIAVEKSIEKYASNYFKTKLEIETTPQEEESVQQSKVCWLCEASFATPLSDEKVRDHDHLTGKYRGAAHSKCNKNVKQKQSNFDSIFSTFFLGMIVILYLKNS